MGKQNSIIIFRYLCTVISALPFFSHAALHFDPEMLSGYNDNIADLSRFEKATQPAGEYSVDIYLNGKFLAAKSLNFTAVQEASSPDEEAKGELRNTSSENASPSHIHDHTGLMACLTKENLIWMGVNVSHFDGLANTPAGKCISPGEYVPQAFTAFDFQKMRLDISIPQAALKRLSNVSIPTEKWDEGITAALFSYQLSGAENRGSFGTTRSNYLNLTSGFNFGPWRLRDNSNWNMYQGNSESRSQWVHQNTYVQRTIIPLKSELTMGDSTTDSDVFDAFSFRGLQISRDDSMYPDTLRGFAPEIHGTAYSNAKVTIREHGNVVYNTYVAAGAFVIDDLFPVSSGGDLEVTVTEANGSVRVFTVPFSSLPVLQRQGHTRFGVTAGRYNRSGYESPAFVQGHLLWGLPHAITAYGGTQIASDYQSIAVGAGINMGNWGALSADITQADSTLSDGSRHDGQSVRFLYARSLLMTGTTFQLAGYRYSTKGFHTFDESALKRMSGWLYDTDSLDASGKPVKEKWSGYYNLYGNKRERIQANISQRIGKFGQLYLSGSRQNYWNDSATATSLQTGFSSAVGHVSYTLSYSYSRMSGQPKADRALYFSLTVPLDVFSPHGSSKDDAHQAWVTYNANRDSEGKLTHQMDISGTALEANNLDWSVSQGYGKQDGNSGDVALGYRGTYGDASVGYGYSADYKQIRYGASGGVVLHSGGITLSEPLGATNILVAAPGASGVPVDNQNGISTDWRGYSVIPYANTYHENRVSLDISRLDNSTDIDDAVDYVVPTKGALVRANFATHSGSRVLMTLTHAGKPLPLGTTVSTSDNSVGMVGEEGQVYLTGLHPQGNIKAKWGSGADQQCAAKYNIEVKSPQPPLVLIAETCY